MPRAFKYSAYESNPEKTENFSGVFVSEKELETETNLGKLILLIRVDSREKKTKDLIQKIKDEFTNHYYLSGFEDPEIALENSCQFFNQQLSEILDKSFKQLSKISILATAIKDDKIFLSRANTGVGVWLLRNNKFFNVLGDDNAKNNQEKNNKKLFDQLISGKLEADDNLLFSSSTIFNYFSQNKIKETLSYSPSQGVSYFRRLIESSIKKDSFAIIIGQYLEPQEINHERKQELINNLKQQGVSNYSMDELVSLEKSTSTLLKSSILGSVTKLVAGGNFLKNVFSKNKNKNKVSDSIRKNFNFITEKISSLLHTVFDQKETINEGKTELPATSPDNINPVSNQLRNIKKRVFSTKFLVLLSLVLICLFIFSLFILSYQQKNKAQKNELQLILSEINTAIESAENALIYQDNNKAREEIVKAQSRLSDLAEQPKANNNISAINDFISRINTVMIKAFNVEVLDNLEPFFELQVELAPDEKLNITSLNVLDNIYLTSGQKIFSIDTKDKSLKTSEHDKGELLGGTALDNKTIIYLSRQGRFVKYDTSTNTLSNLEIDMTNEKTVAAFKTYAQRIYLADRENKQIFKHDYLNNRFIAGKAWIIDNTDISQIKDLAVDGSVYTLNADGTINKMFSGRKQIYSVTDNLDKTLVGATKIFTSQNLSDLYVLDPANNRLLLIDKEKQTITKQFYASSFTDLKNFWVSANGKLIYLVNGNKLFLINN